MGCGSCGGGGGARAFLNTSGNSAAWASAAANRAADNVVWIVTYPDGTTAEFGTDSAAYQSIARTGGGIRSEIRSP